MLPPSIHYRVTGSFVFCNLYRELFYTKSSAEAAANDGVTGDSIEGASIAANGIWVYQMTKKGLTLDASIKGTKIYVDKKLNTYDEQETS